MGSIYKIQKLDKNLIMQELSVMAELECGSLVWTTRVWGGRGLGRQSLCGASSYLETPSTPHLSYSASCSHSAHSDK